MEGPGTVFAEPARRNRKRKGPQPPAEDSTAGVQRGAAIPSEPEPFARRVVARSVSSTGHASVAAPGEHQAIDREQPSTQIVQQDDAADVSPQALAQSIQPCRPAFLEAEPHALNNRAVDPQIATFVRRLTEQRDLGWHQTSMLLQHQQTGGWTVYNILPGEPTVIIRSDLVEVEEPPQPVTPPEALAAPSED